MSTTRTSNTSASTSLTSWYVSTDPNDEPTDDQLAAVEHQIGVPVEFDRSTRLSGAIEIRVACNRLECVLVPKAVRVTRDSPVRELIEAGGVVGRCRAYTEIICALRRLLCTFDEVQTRRRPSPEHDPDFQASHAALRSLQITALARLDRIMGIGVITLQALDREIGYFTQCHHYYQRVLAPFERGAGPATPITGPDPWDEDTLDHWEIDEP